MAALAARKVPRQPRAQITVAAIHEATLDILTSLGADRVTTTRIAERAGVSVGSLYQYYPGKQALLVAVLEAHLERVTRAVEGACARLEGATLAQIGAAIPRAYLDAKLADARAATALYRIAESSGGPAAIARLKKRSAAAVEQLLVSTGRFEADAVPRIVAVAVDAIGGPVRSLLETSGPEGPDRQAAERLARELGLLLSAYLEARAAQSIRPMQ